MTSSVKTGRVAFAVMLTLIDSWCCYRVGISRVFDAKLFLI